MARNISRRQVMKTIVVAVTGLWCNGARVASPAPPQRKVVPLRDVVDPLGSITTLVYDAGGAFVASYGAPLRKAKYP